MEIPAQLIYPGIDLEKFVPQAKNSVLMKKLDITPEDFVVLFTGEYDRLEAIDDILDAFQITNTTFGANINYASTVEKYVKLSKGSYSSMIIYLTDQNNNPIILNDSNLLITLLFKKIISS
jgi:glycosyltransferase involved in cell wall biosynthesis